MKPLHYKGFLGSIEADIDSKCLYGKLLYITDLITYEAFSVAELEREFKKAVDDYLKTCKQLKREPLKPFKGSLNIRLGAGLHKDAALQAMLKEMTLNEYVKIAVQHQIQEDSVPYDVN